MDEAACQYLRNAKFLPGGYLSAYTPEEREAARTLIRSGYAYPARMPTGRKTKMVPHGVYVAHYYVSLTAEGVVARHLLGGDVEGGRVQISDEEYHRRRKGRRYSRRSYPNLCKRHRDLGWVNPIVDACWSCQASKRGRPRKRDMVIDVKDEPTKAPVRMWRTRAARDQG